MIVPFAPGGATDIVARIIAQQLTSNFGKPFVVENLAGAGGGLGTATAMRASANGHTLLIATVGSLVTGPILRRNAGQTNADPAEQALPVTRFYASGSVVMVNPILPARSVSELIQYARRNPDKLFYGSAGNGSNSHLIAEYFKWVGNVRIDHVPFRGTAPAFADLLANRIQIVIESQPTALPSISAGKVRALAVTARERVPALPNVPSVAETPGMESFEAVTWVGLVAPPGTPRIIVVAIHRAVADIAAMPDIQERMKALGAAIDAIAPDDFSAFLKGERAKWSEVIRVGGITGE